MDNNGAIFLMVANHEGQQGDDTKANYTAATLKASGSIVGRMLVSVEPGNFHTTAKNTSGTLHACGWNSFG